MAKKKKPKCTQLEPGQAQQLARLIISQAEVDIHRGGNRHAEARAACGECGHRRDGVNITLSGELRTKRPLSRLRARKGKI